MDVWNHRRLQHWKSKVLYWKQRRADRVWNEKRHSLLELTNILEEGSQAAANLAEAAATAKPTDALKADIREFKDQMSRIWPRLSRAQAAASGLSTAASSQISLLVQCLFDLHKDLGNASARLDEAPRKLKGFVRRAHQLTQDVQDVDVGMYMRSWLQGDHERPASDPASAYKEFWDRLNFEHELLNRRITWLLTSQTILFAAYGFTVAADDPLAMNFQRVIAGSGVIAAILMFIGILGVCTPSARYGATTKSTMILARSGASGPGPLGPALCRMYACPCSLQRPG